MWNLIVLVHDHCLFFLLLIFANFAGTTKFKLSSFFIIITDKYILFWYTCTCNCILPQLDAAAFQFMCLLISGPLGSTSSDRD